jgi:hypothetical protein
MLRSLVSRINLTRSIRQLTKLPADSGRKFAGACIDSPSDAETYETTLRDGDIVVAYVIFQPLLYRLPFADDLIDRWLFG